MSSARFTTISHVFPGQHIRHNLGATRHKEEDVLYLEVKQYTPLNNTDPQEGDITIIGASANGFPKEMYEPFYDELLAHSEARGLRIRSIWLIDKSDHAASSVINEHTQGDDPSASDVARDLLHMVNIFRKHMTLPLIGVGHSLGGTSILELSLIHPRLFAGLIMVDPVIGPSSYEAGYPMLYTSSRRSELWGSRESAGKTFRAAVSFKSWAPRVMELWLQYGLRNTPTLLYPEPGNVTLSTTRANEAWNYSRSWFDPLPNEENSLSEHELAKYREGREIIFDTYPFYHPESTYVWEALPQIQSAVLYIFPDDSPMSPDSMIVKKMAQTGSGRRGSGGEQNGMTAKTIIPDCGHLVAFEKPKECAEAAASWLATSLQRWNERRKYAKDNKDDKSINQVALSAEWIKRAKQGFEEHKRKSKAKM